MIQLELPWPPSLWSLYYIKNWTKWALRPRGRVYRDDALTLICKQLGGKPEPMLGPVSVSIAMHPNKRTGKKKWDMDNRLKILLDSLTHAEVWQDDSQIWELHCYRKSTLHQGAMLVTVAEI